MFKAITAAALSTTATAAPVAQIPAAPKKLVFDVTTLVFQAPSFAR